MKPLYRGDDATLLHHLRTNDPATRCHRTPQQLRRRPSGCAAELHAMAIPRRRPVSQALPCDSRGSSRTRSLNSACSPGSAGRSARAASPFPVSSPPEATTLGRLHGVHAESCCTLLPVSDPAVQKAYCAARPFSGSVQHGLCPQASCGRSEKRTKADTEKKFESVNSAK